MEARAERRAVAPLAGRSLRRARVDTMFRALADGTRLRILNLLRAGELCVGDLVTILGLPQPTTSRHLAYLRRAGLVTVRKEGLWCFYALARPNGPVHGKLLECIAVSASDVPALACDLKRAEKVRNSGGCCPY